MAASMMPLLRVGRNKVASASPSQRGFGAGVIAGLFSAVVAGGGSVDFGRGGVRLGASFIGTTGFEAELEAVTPPELGIGAGGLIVGIAGRVTGAGLAAGAAVRGGENDAGAAIGGSVAVGNAGGSAGCDCDGESGGGSLGDGSGPKPGMDRETAGEGETAIGSNSGNA